MKSSYKIKLGIILFNIVVSILMIFQNSGKVFISSIWLHFLFILMFMWNILLINLIIKSKKNEKNILYIASYFLLYV